MLYIKGIIVQHGGLVPSHCNIKWQLGVLAEGGCARVHVGCTAWNTTLAVRVLPFVEVGCSLIHTNSVTIKISRLSSAQETLGIQLLHFRVFCFHLRSVVRNVVM